MIESVQEYTCIACKYYFGDGIDGYWPTQQRDN